MREALIGIISIAETDRAVLAAEASANVAGWALLVSIVLLFGALRAAKYAKKAWEAARDSAAHSNAQLQMAKTAADEREASQVSAWLRKTGKDIKVYVRNGNGGPVYDVRCNVAAKPSVACSEPCVEIWHDSWIALSPAVSGVNFEEKTNLNSDGYVLSFTTRDGQKKTANGGENVRLDSDDAWSLWDGQSGSIGIAVELYFRDSAGKKWRRAWDGKLAKVA